ncbi:glycoside hydrolase family 55 protein [Podospora conica]|nr:glycoside hydrolase family 55 protein [Schizothecium conicum]
MKPIVFFLLWPLAILGYHHHGAHPVRRSLHEKRVEYDAQVHKWLRENPQHSFPPSDTTVQDLWERLQDADRRSARGATYTDPPASETRLRPRKIATSLEINDAGKLVNAAIAEAKERSFKASARPKHNHYTLRRPSSSGQAPAGIDTARFDAEQEKILQAAAILAEADAANATDKDIFREYTIAYRDSLDGPVQHRIHSPGRLKARADYWLAELGARYPGGNPFGSANAGYKVFRNVKHYGARGDGTTDDTAAINLAISDQARCGANCGSSTVKGATIYFPPGRYLVSGSIFALYHSQLVGDPHDLPVLVASKSFSRSDLGVIAANKYTGVWNDRWKGDDEWYLNTANFFRQVRNFIIDIRDAAPENMKGIHWQVAQATSLQNVHFKMKPGSKQVGLFIENGSGGLLSGNQQFTSRNLIFEGCKTAITMLWDWGWVWQGLYVQGSDVGINFTTQDFPGGSITVLDSTFNSVKTAIVFNTAPKKSPKQASLSLLNVEYKDVGDMVFTGDPATNLRGGAGHLTSWFIGNTFSDVGQGGGASKLPSLNSQKDAFVAGKPGGVRLDPNIPSGLRRPGKAGSIFARSKPQYEDRHDFLVPTAKGDGRTDDTAALNLAFRLAAEKKQPVFLPAGSYIVTDTVFIPKDSIIVGACWSQIVASGKRFEDMANPRPMIKVGNPGDEGPVEISDLLFTARGPTAGLVAMEWNIKSSSQGNAAMWDSHFRIGGAAGTQLQVANCPRLSGAVKPACIAGSLLLHLTKTSSAYLENIWVWTADHDLDDKPSLSEAQVDIYVARGILIESNAPTWLYATSSEHNILYQYQLHKADSIFMGLIQTESPYFHPQPTAPKPFESSLGKFPADPTFKDCTTDNCKVSWALSIIESRNVHIVGAGLYSWFFNNYDQGCIEKMSCQTRLVNIDLPSTSLYIYNLFTVGTQEMISLEMMETSIMAKDNQMLADRSPWTSIIAAFVKSVPSQIIITGAMM